MSQNLTNFTPLANLNHGDSQEQHFLIEIIKKQPSMEE